MITLPHTYTHTSTSYICMYTHKYANTRVRVRTTGLFCRCYGRSEGWRSMWGTKWGMKEYMKDENVCEGSRIMWGMKEYVRERGCLKIFPAFKISKKIALLFIEWEWEGMEIPNFLFKRSWYIQTSLPILACRPILSRVLQKIRGGGGRGIATPCAHL